MEHSEVMPVGDHGRIWCFADQVKLTLALVRDLDGAIKEVKLLEEHEEESSQNVTELEALRKRLREDAQKMKEEKTKLEGMVESHDELITEIAKEIGLDCMGEYAEDEVEDEDADDGGGASAPPVHAPPTAIPKEIIEEEGPEERVPKQEAYVAHEVILADAELEMPQPRLYHTLMRDYEESPSRMMDDLGDLDDLNEDRSDMDE
jgi:hypothetical protein